MKDDRFAMRNFAETMQRVGRAARELSERLTQNEDNTMKYRVATDILSKFDENEIINNRIDITGGHYEGETNGNIIHQDVIERNPDWFEPVEQVQEGKYYYFEGVLFPYIIRCNGEYDEHNIYGQHFPLSDMGAYDESFQGNRSHLKREATTDEMEQVLIKEAKRRGLLDGGTRVNPLDSGGEAHWLDDCFKFEYDSVGDILFVHERVIYEEGSFAEIVDQTPHIEINGNKVEFKEDGPNIGCRKYTPKVPKKFAEYIRQDDLYIYRNGEDITDKILKIAEYYE